MRTSGQRNRDRRGRYTRDPSASQRNAQAAEMRSAGRSYDEIAKTLGFASKGAAHGAVQRALDAVPEQAVEQLRALEDVRLDAALAAAFQVLHAPHPLVSNGRRFDDLTDAAPILGAVREIVRISARRAALHGLDAPTRRQVEVLTESMVDAEITRLTAVLDEHPPPEIDP